MDDEIVKEFLVESHENLDQLDVDLVAIENDPSDPEVLSRIFRTIHTIKGSCGFLGFTKLEWITHVGENLLSPLRDGRLQLSGEITTALLSLVDAIREMLSSIENTGREGDADYESLVSTLTRLHDQTPATASESQVKVAAESEAAPAATRGTEPLQPTTGQAERPHDSPQSGTQLPEDADNSRRAQRRVEQFLMDSYEFADQLDRDLVTLEAEPANRQLLGRIVGTLHSLKSASGLHGFKATEAAVHEGENLLDGLHHGRLRTTPKTITALLSLVDAIRGVLVAIETTGSESEIEFDGLIETLKRLQQPAQEDESAEVAAVDAPCQAESNTASPRSPGPQADAAAPPAQVAKPGADSARAASLADTSIRVDVGLLDRLMDQVGELVLARNRIMQFADIQQDRSVLAAYQRLDLITSELQEGVMKTRMQPIGTIWNKFPRVVRDLARECGKRVDLTMEGEETELDRTLIEAIRDPLTHLVRNAVDHGIETPQQRQLAGKPESGRLFLRAFHEGGQVNIEIADDGGGIDPERILKHAMDRSLITADQAATMNPMDVLKLIFVPGFSTAPVVTNVSGRGVGMDVVRNNIEKIKGTIDVQSQPGKGTTVNVKIPLTLAIIPALIIRSGGDRYAIPQASLLELLRLEGDDAGSRIETIQGAPVFRLRGKLLPLVFLEDELAEEAELGGGPRRGLSEVTNVVVLQADQRQFGLVVQQVLDTEEIVVKALGKQLKNLDIFAGATIMGDGDVALILDVLGLAQRSRVLSQRSESLEGASEQEPDRTANVQTLLLLESSAGQRMAMPLSRVTRLEKFPSTAVEQSGPRLVVQYWGHVMPLVHLSDCLAGKGSSSSLPQAADANADALDVVVLTVASRSVGLVVDRIVDTVQETIEIQPPRRPAILGTVVVGGQVTEFLDVDQILRVADPDLADQPASAGVGV